MAVTAEDVVAGGALFVDPRAPKVKREKAPPKKKAGLWLPGMPWKVGCHNPANVYLVSINFGADSYFLQRHRCTVLKTRALNCD